MGTNQRAAIVLDEAEIGELLDRSRIATIATIGPTGTPHLVPMWYAVLDGEIWFHTKAKSQKVVNLRRDPRITALVESGHAYDQLRGVSIDGRAEIVDDPDKLFDVGVNVFERYTMPYTEELRPAVAGMLNKRVAVRIVAERTRSWDHRKLGIGEVPLGGTTAAYLDHK